MWKSLQTFSNWNNIKEELNNLINRKYKTEQIIELLGRFRYYSQLQQNPKTNYSKGSFSTLVEVYGKQLPQIFSKMANFVIKYPIVELPLFVQGQDKQFSFKKRQILYLYCIMMLGLIPRQPFDHSLQARSKFNYLMDFSFIFSQEEYKTKTVVEFFKKEIDNIDSYDQKLTIHRQVQKRSLKEIIYSNKENPMSKLTIESNEASIEDYYGDLKADFANKFLGGGALMSGCVQEELMFANHPELFTAQLLCEVMKPNECIFLSGYKKYFKNTGYGWTAKYDGPQTHQYKYAQGQAMEYITAIDALHLGHNNSTTQWEGHKIDREILKAYCGFNFKNPFLKRVVTGNWGCGAFGGNVPTKFLIQWLACSLANKEMIYCPFGQRDNINDPVLIEKLQGMKVGETYNLIHQACSNLLKEDNGYNIFKAVKDLL